MGRWITDEDPGFVNGEEMNLTKVIENLDLLGKWLEANGEAIYETKPVEPFIDGQVAYTAKGD